tara:strand:+ start:2598 stop:2819 length:222 start_codon:yes stop_codon:yes gene_type:complete
MKANGWGSSLQNIDSITIDTIQSFHLIPAGETYMDDRPVELYLTSKRRRPISINLNNLTMIVREAEQYPAPMY